MVVMAMKKEKRLSDRIQEGNRGSRAVGGVTA